MNEQSKANELLSSGVSPYYNHNIPPNPPLYDPNYIHNPYNPPQPPMDMTHTHPGVPSGVPLGVSGTPGSMYTPSDDPRMQMIANNSMNTSVLSSNTPISYNTNSNTNSNVNRNVIYIPTAGSLPLAHTQPHVQYTDTPDMHHTPTSIPVVSNKNPGNRPTSNVSNAPNTPTSIYASTNNTKRSSKRSKSGSTAVNMIQRNIDNINYRNTSSSSNTNSNGNSRKTR